MDETRSPGLKPGSSDATTSPTAPPCNASPNRKRRAPAVHSGIGRGNLTDFARWCCLAQWEVRVITCAVDHATAHIGVDRHPEILHLHFAKCGGGHGHRGELEIVRSGRADEAAFRRISRDATMIKISVANPEAAFARSSNRGWLRSMTRSGRFTTKHFSPVQYELASSHMD